MPIVARNDRDGIAVLTWDQPGAPVNTKTRAAQEELAQQLEAALADDSVVGIVLASGKRGFVAGGDLRDLQRVTDPAEATALVKGVRAVMRRMEKGGKPVVAAINGAAMGGGVELALACHARVAASDALLGLPEVTLGLMPGAGGTQRLPRLIGVGPALDLLTGGKPVDAVAALEMGLVDRVVPRDDLLDAAIALARATRPVQPWDRVGAKPQAADAALFAKARAQCARRSGIADIAEAAILDVIETGFAQPFEAALETERRAFAGLVVSPTAKNRIRLHFALNDARAIKGRPQGEPLYHLRSVAVVGGGTMGGGIAFTAAAAGLAVTLIEVGDEALARGLAAIAKTGERQVKAGRMTPADRDAVLARIKGQRGYAGLAEVDAGIEAVVEVEAVKAAVLQQLSAAIRPGGPVASNTSTLPITTLAGYCADPEAFIGAHFFGPVERMPLVEVICGAQTSQATLARMLDLLKLLRKTPIVVQDGLGFYTSRVVASYTGEAMTLLGEGVSAGQIDRVATEFGMVIGPCAMNDMTGLPLLIDIFSSVRSDDTRVSNRGNRAVEVLQALVEAGRTGRRDGAGIYDYAEGKLVSWGGLAALFPRQGTAMPDAEIRKRLMHAQALETVRAMEEGILANATDADVGSVLGWMFPRGFGGVLSYVDTIGARRFVAECDALAAAYGGRFEAPQSLRDMAARDGRFHAL
ncbi:MAG: enoyl-CoA hydratase/isomerase family protein [Proteobacteria bacterium]|nr:enoyl-CoA hydratase/isomerase family protein [Pseudomonadota bacterium]